MRRLVLLFLLVPFFAVSQLTGKIVKVKDGDTVVILSNGIQHTIRVADIDCPEKGQPYSKVAKDFVLNEVAGQEVEIKEKNKDRYGRIVGFVLYSGKNLSEELLKRGLAWHYKHFSDDAYLAKLEREARA